MDKAFYFERLYPFQNEVLQLINKEDTPFYLTGGTAVSRGFLNHRFSDDLDLFVNDDDLFPVWAERVIFALSGQDCWKLSLIQKEKRFLRALLNCEGLDMKIELVNDVRARTGHISNHPLLGRLDSPENILANKITALLDREEPKDLADIWGLCCNRKLSLAAAIQGAQGKAAGVFPADLARILCSVTCADWEAIRWIEAPPIDGYLRDLRFLGEELIL